MESRSGNQSRSAPASGSNGLCFTSAHARRSAINFEAVRDRIIRRGIMMNGGGKRVRRICRPMVSSMKAERLSGLQD
jgi:hypothetical protein